MFDLVYSRHTFVGVVKCILAQGTILDPFLGGGSTIAAAVAVGYNSIGVELDSEFFAIAERAIPKLAKFGQNGSSCGPNGKAAVDAYMADCAAHGQN